MTFTGDMIKKLTPQRNEAMSRMIREMGSIPANVLSELTQQERNRANFQPNLTSPKIIHRNVELNIVVDLD